MTIKLAANAIKARLFDADRDTRLAVSEFLSYQVENAERTELFQSGRWDGRSSFYDFQTDTFPAGFVPVVARELRRLGCTVALATKPPPPPLGPAPGTVDLSGFGFNPRYDYQPETVRRLLTHGRMVAQVATGGGKSHIARMAVQTIGRPSLFLTTRTVLMDQMRKAFAEAGMTAGVLGDGTWAPRRGVNVGMVQTFTARLASNHPEREATLKLLQLFELVIGEEAHEVGGASYFEVLNHCPNAHYRLAMTATPFMRPDGEANMRLMAAFGPVGIQVSEAELINRGILAQPSFKLLATPAPPMLRRSTRWPTCYDLGIVENQERNRSIVQEASRAAGYGLPVMALVQRKRHGEILEAAAREAGLRAEFIFGKHELDQRTAALARLKSGETQMLIGSTILDVGVDVPAVGLVILAGGGKAEVQLRQRIGRGLREKKAGPNVCFVLDFQDAWNKTLWEHALTRRAILEETDGFREGILPDGADFNYAQFNHNR